MEKYERFPAYATFTLLFLLLTIGRLADIDLTTLTSNLDNTASEIVTYQRDSTVQRKDLAQKTNVFSCCEYP